MKFDVVMMNPPYAEKRGHALYVKFLNKCFDNCETLISVNPSPILKTFRKGGTMKKQYTMFRKSVDENYCEILDVDNEFDMCGLNDLIIIMLKHAEEHKIIYKDKKYDNYLDFCWAQVPPYLIDFNNHITQFFHDTGCDIISEHIHVTKYYSGFCLQDKKIEPPQDKLFCYFMKAGCSFNYLRYKDGRYHYPLEYNQEDQRKSLCYVNFELDEYEKANNFLDYLNTKFILTCIELADKTDYACGEKFNIMPWLDFSKPWTDKELFEMIGMKYNKEEIYEVDKK